MPSPRLLTAIVTACEASAADTSPSADPDPNPWEAHGRRRDAPTIRWRSRFAAVRSRDRQGLKPPCSSSIPGPDGDAGGRAPCRVPARCGFDRPTARWGSRASTRSRAAANGPCSGRKGHNTRGRPDGRWSSQSERRRSPDRRGHGRRAASERHKGMGPTRRHRPEWPVRAFAANRGRIRAARGAACATTRAPLQPAPPRPAPRRAQSLDRRTHWARRRARKIAATRSTDSAAPAPTSLIRIGTVPARPSCGGPRRRREGRGAGA
jgi:hypothetical protein